MIFGRLHKYVAQHSSLSDDDFGHLLTYLTPKSLLRNQTLPAPAQGCQVEAFVERGCLRIYSPTQTGLEPVLDFAIEGSHRLP